MSGAGSSSLPSLYSLLLSPIRMGDVVGRGAWGVREGAVDRKELDEESVGVTTGVEEVAGGRLEDGMGVEVGVYAGMIEENGVDCTGFDEFPSQTNWQGVWDKALSKLSHT